MSATLLDRRTSTIERLLPRRLSGRMWRLVRFGDDGRYGGDRSRLALAVCTACVGTGWTFEQALALFLDPRNAISEWLRVDYRGRPRSMRAAARQLERAWAKAAAFAEHSPGFRCRADVIEHVLGVLEAAGRDLHFRGVGGATAHAVLVAHGAIALRAGKVEYGAASRELAELAGVSRPTATRATRRLLVLGYVRRTTLNRGARPVSFRLRLPGGGGRRSTIRSHGSERY